MGAHAHRLPTISSCRNMPLIALAVSPACLLCLSIIRIIIFSGGAEVFSAECDALAQNLRDAGLEVEEYKEEDEMHGFLLVPTFMSDKVAPALHRMRTFLTSG